MTKTFTPPTLDMNEPVKEAVRDLFSDLMANGLVDLKTGQIESRCDPQALKELLNLVR